MLRENRGPGLIRGIHPGAPYLDLRRESSRPRGVGFSLRMFSYSALVSRPCEKVSGPFFASKPRGFVA